MKTTRLGWIPLVAIVFAGTASTPAEGSRSSIRDRLEAMFTDVQSVAPDGGQGAPVILHRASDTRGWYQFGPYGMMAMGGGRFPRRPHRRPRPEESNNPPAQETNAASKFTTQPLPGIKSTAINDPSCGKSRLAIQRIVNGVSTTIENFPWQVSLDVVAQRTSAGKYLSHTCGASIINSRWLLTAAHCVRDHTAKGMEVIIGRTDLTRDQANNQFIPLERIVPHPKYNKNSQENDIALIKLARDIHLDGITTGTVCLPAAGADVAAGSTVAASGWGKTGENGKVSVQSLQMVYLKTVSDGFCAARYGRRVFPAVMTCAGGSMDGKDTCGGDSGGPLVRYERGRGELVGVTSFGSGCGRIGMPGVYTKVSNFIPWITSTIRT